MTKRKVVAKRAPATSKVKAVTIFSQKGLAYKGMNRVHFSSQTIAALTLSLFVTLTAKGKASATKNGGHKGVFKKVVGETATRYWGPNVSTGKMDADGLAAVQERLDGEAAGGYNAKMDIVNKFVNAMKKGGKHEIDGKTYDFSEKHTVDL